MWHLPAVRCAGQIGWCERPHRRWSSKSHAWRGLPVVWSSWGSSSLTHYVGCSNHIMPQVLPCGLLSLMCMGERVSPSVIGTNLTRIVGEQIYPDRIEMPDRGMAPVLQIGRMSVPTEVEAEWNAWYNNEYIPGYRKVPGVIYARRYRVHEGTSGYTTVYEFESTAVPQSAEVKEQQQHSSPNSPRMRQAMTHAPGSAGVYTRIDP